MTRRTILAGDFNCVTNIALDLKRTCTSPYPNKGGKELRDIIEKKHLADEIRLSQGLDFIHTSRRRTRAGGICLSRIDNIFTFDVPGANWAAHVKHDMMLRKKDHSPVVATLTFNDSLPKPPPRSKAVKRVNEKVMLNPKHHRALEDIVSRATARHSNNEPVEEILRDLKKTAKSYLLRSTKQLMDDKQRKLRLRRLILKAAQEQLACNPTPENYTKVDSIEDAIISLQKKVSPPRADKSYHAFRKDECMSAQFWQTAYKKTREAQPSRASTLCRTGMPPL